MIELNQHQTPLHQSGDVKGLRQLAASRRNQYRQQLRSFNTLRQQLLELLLSPGRSLRQLPSRFLLHTIVALTIPISSLIGYLPQRAPEVIPTPSALPVDDPVGITPINTEIQEALPLIGDPPLDEDDALPAPLSLASRSDLLAPLMVPAMVLGDVVRMRNGPGLAYDEVSRINGGESVEVVGRHEEWLQLRREGDTTVYWVAAELVEIPEAVLYNLTQVPTELIPPPPPPKIGVVREEGVNLRDGPGTNYVSMARMGLGQELTLIERFEGWFLVEYGQIYGWVTSEFLNIVPGVVERIPVAQAIPDPNPPLVGTVTENAVNLRKGPGSAYDRLGSIDAGLGVSLLARHKDWFQVQLTNGTKAWVFSDLLKVSPMAVRRVPVTNDIPALPTRSRAISGAAANIPASGDVANYAVQFVGSRYVWGGSSPSRGFDCSGLTSFVYRQFGVNLPHNAAAQYSTRYGAMIGGMNNLAPGDLMYFVNTGGRRGITHVSIYIGGGRMVHAMTPRYGVQVSSIRDSYWQNSFIGAIRPYR